MIKLSRVLDKNKIKGYIGFAEAYMLVAIMCLRLFAKYGHRPVLIGGGTTELAIHLEKTKLENIK